MAFTEMELKMMESILDYIRERQELEKKWMICCDRIDAMDINRGVLLKENDVLTKHNSDLRGRVAKLAGQVDRLGRLLKGRMING